MANPTAAMLVIGDEILSGRTRDANMHFLARELSKAGIELKEVRVVSDDHNGIVQAVNDLRNRWDNVFTSGGIGPTHDDITAEAVAGAFKAPIGIRDDARALLEAHYKKSATEINEARLRMARVPDGAVLIENPISAAPGFSLENVHVMAGVPVIFQTMVASLMPKLTGGAPVLSRNMRLNLPEGEIAGPLGKLAGEYPEVSIGSYPFIVKGVFGSNIVLRSPDKELLQSACAKFISVFPTAIEQ